ncbi:GIY-YIG nuclease family protein [Candidatus Gottesmanbacteria bacterium]|nr:GIY-YIG nuclease family protein [Candidatus Gottesmanbacteria bacterium]
MAFVYILKSFKKEKYYIGTTENYERRVREHNSGRVRSTKYIRPLNLVLVSIIIV